MTVSEETLMAFADGELSGALHDQVARAVASDPELARRVAAHQALRDRLRAGFAPVLAEPVPARLVATARSGASDEPGKVLHFAAQPARRRPWVQWGSLAASFVLGAFAWYVASRGPITEHQGQLVASGTLARALNGQLAAQQDAPAAVRIGLSFRDHHGDYCRTFQLGGDTAGLACHQNDEWAVQALARSADAPAAGQYRQAASALPPAILEAVQASIVGDPLDATAESQARAQHWRTQP